MCLIAFALNTHPRYPLVLIANRDEFHARESEPADFWPHQPELYGGRDVRAGGSWMLASRHGALAAVTNVRTGQPESAARSRGQLVVRAALSEQPDRACAEMVPESRHYGRFNLLAYRGGAMTFLGNHPEARTFPVANGVHTLSNATLDEPWPKTRKLESALVRWIESGAESPDPLFAALADPSQAADHELPSTGVPIEWERRLSAAFIHGSDYGTRASTVVLIEPHQTRFIERCFGRNGVLIGERDEFVPIE